MKFNEFKEKIESIYAEKFPKSSCKVTIYRCLGQAVCIDCLLAENPAECPYQIPANDTFSISFMAHLPDGWTAPELPENLTLASIKNSVKVKSDNKYLYCDLRHPTYRKISGNPEKIISAFQKYVNRLDAVVCAEYKAENLLPDGMALIKSKRYYI